ncbi:carboxymuconolactone decarboxylase family protein [Streptomyces sp. NPDC056983]|uniref:carboxymuconolactone decarboxylase family protein n=1 Tax=Streptomyces sp. NPDC056983 TaxID=3345987 RepID=UPI00363F9FBF
MADEVLREGVVLLPEREDLVKSVDCHFVCYVPGVHAFHAKARSPGEGCPASTRLVTICALAALGKMDQLQFHLGFAHENGVTDEELQEALLHLAFYSGWPNGMAATSVLKNIVEQQD